jgi:large subunit ribosomal protein L4
MKATVTTLDAKKAGEIELADAIYGLEPRSDILHRMVRWQQLKRMAGTHHAQDRSEVSVTGKKMYKQKGTGGARHGSRRAAQFVGGAKAHGPVVRSHAFDLPKKLRALGLRLALSSKVKTGSLMVVDTLAVDVAKTAALRARFDKLGVKSALVVGGAEVDNNFKLAVRNIPGVDVLPTQGLNVYDVLRRDTLVLSRDAVEAIQARLGQKEAA